MGEETTNFRAALSRLREATPQHYDRAQFTRDSAWPTIERKIAKGDELTEWETEVVQEVLRRRREESGK